MKAPLRSLLAGTLLLACLASCAGGRGAPGDAPAARQSPREVGVVALVNADVGFVLIDVDMGLSPNAGVALKTFAPGTEPAASGESAVLAVSPERRPPFIAANIVQGMPQKGDLVYQ